MEYKLSYSKISNDKTSATMSMVKRIGNLYDENGNCIVRGIDGEQFANEMLYLKAACGIENITVEINSEGGDVIQGYTIANAIQIHKANTRAIGLAASMAGVCLAMGENRSAVNYATIMCHPAASKDAKAASLIGDTLKQMFMNKTKMDETKISDIMGKETWMSCAKKADYTLQDAVDMGIIDEVENCIKSPVKISNTQKLSIENMMRVYNSLNENQTIMTKVNAALKLNVNASDDSAAEAVKELQDKLTAAETKAVELEAKNTELQGKIDAAEAAKESEKNTAAEVAVENAFNKKLFKADKKADMLVLAKANLAAFNSIMETAGTSKVAPQIFNATGSEADKKKIADRADWNYKDWMKKDPKELEAISNGTSVLFAHIDAKELYNSTFTK